MPCDSSYLEPSLREQELRLSAQLYAYVLEKLKRKIPHKLAQDAQHLYGGDDYIPKLCEVLKNLDRAQQDVIIYNARDPQSRKLADWWEKHQAADREREAQEARMKTQKDLRESALSKLTREEIKALKELGIE